MAITKRERTLLVGTITAVVLHALGVNIPIHNLGHVELTYLAAALYLLRK